MDKHSLSHTSWECVPRRAGTEVQGEGPVRWGRRGIGEILRTLAERMDGAEIMDGTACADHMRLPEDGAQAHRQRRRREAEGQERDNPV